MGPLRCIFRGSALLAGLAPSRILGPYRVLRPQRCRFNFECRVFLSPPIRKQVVSSYVQSPYSPINLL